MKKTIITICSTTFLFFACTNSKTGDEVKTEEKTAAETTAASAEIKKEAMPELDSATKAKNWQMYMTPSDPHKMMAKWNGNWNADATFYEPGKPEMKSKSAAVNKMIFNGLYQETSFSGDMMGMPFTGKSTTAYDNHKKVFKSTWIDNMGSGIMVLEGPWDEANKMMALKGKSVDPSSGYEMDVRETFKIIDDNNQEMEMFLMMPDGKEFKTMNIKFTRKK